MEPRHLVSRIQVSLIVEVLNCKSSLSKFKDSDGFYLETIRYKIEPEMNFEARRAVCDVAD